MREHASEQTAQKNRLQLAPWNGHNVPIRSVAKGQLGGRTTAPQHQPENEAPEARIIKEID